MSAQIMLVNADQQKRKAGFLSRALLKDLGNTPPGVPVPVMVWGCPNECAITTGDYKLPVIVAYLFGERVDAECPICGATFCELYRGTAAYSGEGIVP